MREDEDAVALPHSVLADLGEHDGLAAAGRQHEQGSGVAGIPLAFHCRPRFLLVGAQFHQKLPAVHPPGVCGG